MSPRQQRNAQIVEAPGIKFQTAKHSRLNKKDAELEFNKSFEKNKDRYRNSNMTRSGSPIKINYKPQLDEKETQIIAILGNLKHQK